MVDGWGTVRPEDSWMPEGFDLVDEAQLHRATQLLSPAACIDLGNWWLAVRRGTQTTPSLDIASTCIIETACGPTPGILLVEAKAHAEELRSEELGKPFKEQNSPENHERIGAAIASSSLILARETGLEWRLSRGSHYQMSNRFAWAAKLAELGIPVILVYLGFLNAEEMADRGRPFVSHSDWESAVLEHSAPIFPEQVWNRAWHVCGQPLIALIKSMEIEYERALVDDLPIGRRLGTAKGDFVVPEDFDAALPESVRKRIED